MATELPHPITGLPHPSPVPPETGWPEDPATADTPVARTTAQVRRRARAAAGDPGRGPAALDAEVSVCRACPRLVEWREQVATDKRAAFADQPYWGRPIPGWGEEAAPILVMGLAPAAHGGNRTGRAFTGDVAGDLLFASLHRVGLAELGTSRHAGDGQRLHGVRVVAPVRCAPPANRPTVTERDTCAPWIEAEVRLLAPWTRVVVALGGYGWDATLRVLRGSGYAVGRPRPRFDHAAEVALAGPEESPGPVTLLGSYHPSQRNIFTGRLTPSMLDTVLRRARELAT